MGFFAVLAASLFAVFSIELDPDEEDETEE